MHPRLLVGPNYIMINDLGRVYLEADRLPDAHILGCEVLRCRCTMPGEYKDAVNVKIDRGITHARLGMWPEAERMQKDVLKYLQVKGPDKPETKDTSPR